MSSQVKQVVGVNGGDRLGGRAAGAEHDVANSKTRSVGHSYGGTAAGDRTDTAPGRMTNGGEETSGNNAALVDSSWILIEFGPFGGAGSLRRKADGESHGKAKQGAIRPILTESNLTGPSLHSGTASFGS